MSPKTQKKPPAPRPVSDSMRQALADIDALRRRRGLTIGQMMEGRFQTWHKWVAGVPPTMETLERVAHRLRGKLVLRVRGIEDADGLVQAEDRGGALCTAEGIEIDGYLSSLSEKSRIAIRDNAHRLSLLYASIENVEQASRKSD